MAATIDSYFEVEGVPFPKTQVQLSTLTAGGIENIAHYGPAGVAPRTVAMEVLTQPLDGSVIQMVHDKPNDSTTNDTARLLFNTGPGGSLNAAVVLITFTFGAMKSGGRNP